VAPVGETAVYTFDRGIVAWANTILRKRLVFLKNGGVGGDTVAQMLARTDALLALNPGWLVGFGHVNSVSAGATVAQITTDLTAIFNKVDAAGVRLVWGTDWSDTAATTAQRAVTYGVNDWLRRQTQVRRNFILVDYQAVFVDPTTGNPVAGYTADGLHQEGLGALPLGQQLANAISPFVERSDRLIASNDDPTNIITNGMMVGNSGPGTASGWGSEGATLVGTRTKVARTDGFPGEWQQVAVTGASGWYFFRWQVNIGATVAVGDTVYAECEFETDADGWAPSRFLMQIKMIGSFAGGTVTQSADMLHASGSPAMPGRIAAGIFRTPPIVVPVGTTSIKVGVDIEEGPGTFRIAKVRLAKPVT